MKKIEDKEKRIRALIVACFPMLVIALYIWFLSGGCIDNVNKAWMMLVSLFIWMYWIFRVNELLDKT